MAPTTYARIKWAVMLPPVTVEPPITFCLSFEDVHLVVRVTKSPDVEYVQPEFNLNSVKIVLSSVLLQNSLDIVLWTNLFKSNGSKFTIMTDNDGSWWFLQSGLCELLMDGKSVSPWQSLKNDRRLFRKNQLFDSKDTRHEMIKHCL